jgi:hypothetical protein
MCLVAIPPRAVDDSISPEACDPKQRSHRVAYKPQWSNQMPKVDSAAVPTREGSGYPDDLARRRDPTTGCSGRQVPAGPWLMSVLCRSAPRTMALCPGKSRVFSAVHSTFELCAAPLPDDNMPHLAKGFV